MPLSGNSSIAKYSCDACRDSKVTCSREHSGCRRCKKNNTECTYSRSGVIRRNRKRKLRSPLQAPNVPETENSSQVQCLPATQVEAVCEKVRDGSYGRKEASPLQELSLSGTCATTGFDNRTSHFHLFEEHAQEWIQIFESFIRERSPLMFPPPPDVMNALRAGRPDRVHQRGWLVIYFSIVLGTVSSDEINVKQKIQHNLQLALSDITVLLIPSELNIDALTLALSQASDSEFMGPSSCWMLATSVCRMFQALGANNAGLDPESCERRKMRFWHLNSLDKGFAIIFGRTPTFHREMVRKIGLPTLNQIQGFTSHQTRDGPSKLFGAHYMYQKLLLINIMGDIWHFLYGEATSERKTETVNNDLTCWYDEAQKVLGAASLTEKPFCNVKHARSIDIALHTTRFHFLYLSILLTRSSACMQEKCLALCRDMLHLLPEMAPESKEPYHPTIWQLVCCPFTPFLILLCDLLSRDGSDLDQKRESLSTLEQLPRYLKALGSQNALAARLEGIATRLVHHAQSHLSHVDIDRFQVNGSLDRDPGHATPRSATGTCYSSWGILPYGRICEMDIVSGNLNPSVPVEVESNIPVSPILLSLRSSYLDFELDDDLVGFANSLDVDVDGGIDWLNWEAQRRDGV